MTPKASSVHKYRVEIARLKRRLRAGQNVEIANIAVAYRAAGDRRRAFAWWQRAATERDSARAFCRYPDGREET
jgi:hypothetical protein